MKVVCTGSRVWTDHWIIRHSLETLTRDTTIIHGNARGADKLVDKIALQLGFTDIKRFPVTSKEWQYHVDCDCPPSAPYCYYAGKRRNELMLKQKPDLVIAFLSRHSKTGGTYGAIAQAMDMDLKVSIYQEW